MPAITRRRVVIAAAVVAVLAVVGVLVAHRGSSSSGQGAAAATTIGAEGKHVTTSVHPATTSRSGTTVRTPTTASAGPTAPNPTVPAPAGMATVSIGSLPREAQHTYDLISAGGPFPYSRDGVVFENRERVLPARSSGYYHEYTVLTPGSSDRGARRMITGKQGERYYTDDHYVTFRFVVAR